MIGFNHNPDSTESVSLRISSVCLGDSTSGSKCKAILKPEKQILKSKPKTFKPKNLNCENLKSLNLKSKPKTLKLRASYKWWHGESMWKTKWDQDLQEHGS